MIKNVILIAILTIHGFAGADELMDFSIGDEGLTDEQMQARERLAAPGENEPFEMIAVDPDEAEIEAPAAPAPVVKPAKKIERFKPSALPSQVPVVGTPVVPEPAQPQIPVVGEPVKSSFPQCGKDSTSNAHMVGLMISEVLGFKDPIFKLPLYSVKTGEKFSLKVGPRNNLQADMNYMGRTFTLDGTACQSGSSIQYNFRVSTAVGVFKFIFKAEGVDSRNLRISQIDGDLTALEGAQIFTSAPSAKVKSMVANQKANKELRGGGSSTSASAR